MIPLWIQWIDIIIGIIGFLLTIGTLLTSLNLKKHLVKRAEIESFRNRKQNILYQIDGFVNSINEDKIFAKDNKKVFETKLLQFIVEIRTSYTFLSNNSIKKTKHLYNLLNKPILYDGDWKTIATELVALKSYLQKEII